MIARITRAYVRQYGDTGQTICAVEFVDHHGQQGSTVGQHPPGLHMEALMTRATREGVAITRERW